jgi:hypothetical protein
VPTVRFVVKRFVEVAWVVVALPTVRNCAVEDALERSPPVYVLSAVHVFVVVVETRSPETAARASVSEYEERQVPPMAKQPPERFTPLAPVVVERPSRKLLAYRLEVVAEVPVAEVNVRELTVPLVAKRLDEVEFPMTSFCAVKMFATLKNVEVAEVPVALPNVNVLTFPLVLKKSVDDAAVKSAAIPVYIEAKKLVEVALVPVAEVNVNVPTVARVAKRSVAVAFVVVPLVTVRNCSVDDALERTPPVNVWSALQVFVVVVETKSPVTASRARGSVKYKLVFSVTSSVVAPPTT